MTNAAITSSQRIPALITQRLRRLRRRITLWFVVDGLSRLLLLIAALVAADLLIDRLFRMDVTNRGIMLLLMVAALGAVVFTRLVRPLAATLSDDTLCLQVEDHHKQLGQSLISAVQFSRMGSDQQRGISPSMVRAVIDHGTHAAQQVDFVSTLDVKSFRWNLLLLAIGLVLFAGGGIGVARNEMMATWFNRNILLGDRLWPQNTYLDVHRVRDGKIVLPRGENWTQIVEVTPDSKVVPSSVYIDVRSSRSSQRMKKSGPRQFELVFQNVMEPFEFRARGGDAITAWIGVELVDSPAVDDLRLHVTLPKYAGGKTEQLPSGKGPYYVLKGSRLSLAGTANKPLSAAELLTGERTVPLVILGQTRFEASLAPQQLVAGKYVIRLTDREGLQSKRPTSFGVNIRPDREPQVRARLFGISGMVVPRARLPIQCRISDDFAVSDVRLVYQWRGADGTSADSASSDGASSDDESSGGGRLDESSAAQDNQGQPSDSRDKASQTNTGTFIFEQTKDQLPQGEVAINEAWELEPLKISAGSGLSFRIEADDNDDVSGPNTGRSPEFLVKVVTEEQLRTDLLRREKEQRQQFERLLNSQEELLTDCRALAAAIAGKAAFGSDDKQTLLTIQRRQKLIETNTATIAARLDEFVVEVHNNRLEEESGPLTRRLTERIIQPMLKLAEQAMPEAVRHLDKTRRVEDEPQLRDATLTQAVAQQQAIAAAMREILTHMVKSEGYQEAVNLLYEIEKSQKNVFDLTQKERQERIRRILEAGGEP